MRDSHVSQTGHLWGPLCPLCLNSSIQLGPGRPGANTLFGITCSHCTELQRGQEEETSLVCQWVHSPFMQVCRAHKPVACPMHVYRHMQVQGLCMYVRVSGFCS